MSRRIVLCAILTGLLLGSTGCRHLCRRGICSSRNEDPPRPRGDLLIPPPTGGLPLAPSPRDSGLPPPTVGSEPSGSRFRPKRETLYPDPLLEAPAISGAKTGEPPPVLTIPDGLGSKSPSNKAVVPAGFREPTKAPIGLPGFAVVHDRISTGRKPTLDGFDTLTNTGYKTAVYLHHPARDVASTKELAEKKGMTFIAIPTEPTGLKAAYGTFVETVGNAAKRPMYVFDDDGVRTGSLWYLYLRTVESLPDDAAQVKAAALGLRDATGDEKTNFWLAIQDYLAKR